jgi:hypothetical protein
MNLRSLILASALALLGANPARADLIGLYTFDDPGNPLNDSSAAGNHLLGTAGTDPVWGPTTGFNATGAYDFSVDRLVAPINVNQTAMPQMSWGAWVRTDTLASNLYKVLGHDNGSWDRVIGLDNRQTGGFRYTSFTGAGMLPNTPGPINTTDWAFIAATYGSGSASMYVDINASTTADPLVVVTGAANFTTAGETTFAIGGISPVNAGEAWDGAIDQVFIYNEVLTPAKVTAIRNRGLLELLGIPPGDPDITVAPANIFGNLTALGVAPGPVARTVTISNVGATQNLNVTGITVSGADAARYSVTPPLPAPVAPGANAVVEVVLTPPAAGGSLVATLNIASNDEDTPVATVGLNATVTTDPNIELVSPSPLFGRMTIHAVPAQITRAITVRNTGVTGTLTVNAPVISGADAASYAIVSAPATVPPGSQADVVVSLTPGAGTSFAASLQITSSDPDSPGFSVPLDAVLVVVPPVTLTAFYSFDDPAAPLRDDSGNGHDITDMGGTNPVWGAATGLGGTGAYDFSQDKLIVPLDVNVGAMPQMSWGAWVRTDTLTTGLYKVLGHDDGAWDRVIGLDNRNPGAFRYTTFTGDANNSGPLENTPGPVNTTDWTFLAATYDQPAQNVTMYIDLDAGTTADPLVTVSEFAGYGIGFPTFAIGSIRPDNPGVAGSEFWDGAIDNVFVYSGILSDEEVKTLRDLGKAAALGADNFVVTSWQVNPNGTVTFTWNSKPGATYTLRFSTDLAGAVNTWADEADDIPSGGDTTTYTTVSSFTALRRVFFAVERN